MERWESGLIHRFAKPGYCENGTGGSNPPLSAVFNNVSRKRNHWIFGKIDTSLLDGELDKNLMTPTGVLKTAGSPKRDRETIPFQQGN